MQGKLSLKISFLNEGVEFIYQPSTFVYLKLNRLFACVPRDLFEAKQHYLL